MSDTEKKSTFRRAGAFGLNKVRPESVRSASRMSIGSGRKAAMEALRPESIDIQEAKTAFKGRYEDGGKQVFAQMVRSNNLSEEDLKAIHDRHRQYAMIYTALSAVFFLIALGMILFTSGQFSIFSSIVLCLFSFGSLIRGVQSDYAAYQVRTRSFCGIHAYLKKADLTPSSKQEIALRK